MPLAPSLSMGLAPPAANVGLALLINGYDRTTFLADQSISIHVGTHGNSKGTLDAKLNDPSPDPASEDVVRAFANTLELYEGRVRSLEVDEWKIGAHHFVKLSAQDDGPVGGLPTAAPFGLSDTPNGTTTLGYRSLRKMVRTTEGGSAKTTYQVVYQGNGLWVNMNVQVTSAILGLSAQEFTIVDAKVQWPNTKTLPTYTFDLNQPVVNLAQLVQNVTLADGAVTSTQISDGAITTPKLAATWANIAGTVTMSAAGIEVTDGALTLRNPGGAIIIDGTSNMFKIAATGTLTDAAGANGSPGVIAQSIESVDIATGFTYVPASMVFRLEGTTISQPIPWTNVLANGTWTSQIGGATVLVNTNQTRIGFTWTAQANLTGGGMTYRYFILQEIAF